MQPVSGIILAAGTSSRMGVQNKLTTEWSGKPLVAHVADAALTSRLAKVVVVTGHDATQVEAVLPEGCLLTHNGDYAGGMAGSIRAGGYRLQGYSPVMILLGDMPLVTTEDINSLVDAFEAADDHKAIVAATCEGEWGNPVLFGRDWFVPLKLLEGDRGARAVLEANSKNVITVEIGEGAHRDFDVPEAFAV